MEYTFPLMEGNGGALCTADFSLSRLVAPRSLTVNKDAVLLFEVIVSRESLQCQVATGVACHECGFVPSLSPLGACAEAWGGMGSFLNDTGLLGFRCPS